MNGIIDLTDRRHNREANCPYMMGPAHCSVCQRLHDLEEAIDNALCDLDNAIARDMNGAVPSWKLRVISQELKRRLKHGTDTTEPTT